MDSMPTMLPRHEVEAMIPDAARAKARELRLTLSPEAERMLQDKASSVLNKLNNDGLLYDRKEEIEHNTGVLIQYIFDEQLNRHPGAITIDHVSDALRRFCQRFPDFIPFCP